MSRNGGATRRQKLLKPGCGRKCRQRCHDRISDEQREKNVQFLLAAWKLGSAEAIPFESRKQKSGESHVGPRKLL